MEEETKGRACPGCGEPVSCGAERGESSCWCTELPGRLPLPGETGGSCYCRRCLEKKLNSFLQPSRA